MGSLFSFGRLQIIQNSDLLSTSLPDTRSVAMVILLSICVHFPEDAQRAKATGHDVIMTYTIPKF